MILHNVELSGKKSNSNSLQSLSLFSFRIYVSPVLNKKWKDKRKYIVLMFVDFCLNKILNNLKFSKNY